MLKSMVLDYIDVDISFIYKTQLKIELSVNLKCRYHYHVRGCQCLSWKLWICKQKYPLRKRSGLHLQSLFPIRQNNTWSIKITRLCLQEGFYQKLQEGMLRIGRLICGA